MDALGCFLAKKQEPKGALTWVLPQKPQRTTLETLSQPLGVLSIGRAYKKSQVCILNRRDYLAQLISMFQPPFLPTCPGGSLNKRRTSI